MNEFIEKLIKLLKDEERDYRRRWKYKGENEEDWQCMKAMQKAIGIVEQLASEHNNGWIPCSGRLPEDRQNVLITDSNGKVRQIVFNKWMYENPQYSHNIIPIAWQPLPAPYKKGE